MYPPGLILLWGCYLIYIRSDRLARGGGWRREMVDGLHSLSRKGHLDQRIDGMDRVGF